MRENPVKQAAAPDRLRNSDSLVIKHHSIILVVPSWSLISMND
jgi:hypothetical protein